ncbi:hypothetical protein [Cupriavidus neocaledonicus]|nr:hypothetical protein [Cupriavidus neocaledonicus]
MSPRTKDLLRRAAESEHRTLSNMLEVLILEYCERHRIQASDCKTVKGKLSSQPRSNGEQRALSHR